MELDENKHLDANYWNNRWEQGTSGWDIGYASPAIVEYMQQYPDKDAAILIPGCGNAYEAKALLDMGFSNITLIDIAPHAVEQLRSRYSNEPRINILHQDFFTLNGQFDLIIEQTFFCALNPELRPDYVTKTYSLLAPGGRIIGLLFDTEFEKQGPPFGGFKPEYDALFAPYYMVHTMERCTNSIPPREGTELFINLQKKTHE